MALIKCSECGKDISDQALNCPNCGFVRNKTKQGRFMWGIALFLLILFIIGAAIINYKYNDTAKKEFMKSCVETSPKLNAFCLCNYNYIVDNYGKKVFSSKEISPEVKGIMEQGAVECFKYVF